MIQLRSSCSMKSYRGLLLLAVPLLGMGLLGVALFLKREPALRVIPAPRPRTSASPAAAMPAAPKPLPRPSSSDQVELATQQARLEATYQNYRTAVATGNRALEQALLPMLRRDRADALLRARQDLDQA